VGCRAWSAVRLVQSPARSYTKPRYSAAKCEVLAKVVVCPASVDMLLWSELWPSETKAARYRRVKHEGAGTPRK